LRFGLAALVEPKIILPLSVRSIGFLTHPGGHLFATFRDVLRLADLFLRDTFRLRAIFFSLKKNI